MTDVVVYVALADLAEVVTATSKHRLASVRRAHEQRIELPPILLRLSRCREPGRFQLLEGNHRLTAARQLGLSAIRAVVIGHGGVPADVAARAYRALMEQHHAAMQLRGQEWPADDRRAGRPPPAGFSLAHERPERPWSRTQPRQGVALEKDREATHKEFLCVATDGKNHETKHYSDEPRTVPRRPNKRSRLVLARDRAKARRSGVASR